VYTNKDHTQIVTQYRSEVLNVSEKRQND